MRAHFRLAARTLVRAPVFTLVSVLVLASGVGATTAVFSVVNAVSCCAPCLTRTQNNSASS